MVRRSVLERNDIILHIYRHGAIFLFERQATNQASWEQRNEKGELYAVFVGQAASEEN
jgi:hypothetical protein